MRDEVETREEWSAGVCSMVTSELLSGTQRGMLTAAEAHQLSTRFLVLLDQALDLPSLRASMQSLNPWDCVI
ncbi:hypothetical protein [Pseudonocardia spinosispora]|uniref:hypothetical protein n=1 Tax=Pseudonocardia spinosispora TaxID=103441 RepID=UPI0003FBFE78|nr:hypothetical protein [Pseudonocardia spinosispora]